MDSPLSLMGSLKLYGLPLPHLVSSVRNWFFSLDDKSLSIWTENFYVVFPTVYKVQKVLFGLYILPEIRINMTDYNNIPE